MSNGVALLLLLYVWLQFNYLRRLIIAAHIASQDEPLYRPPRAMPLRCSAEQRQALLSACGPRLTVEQTAAGVATSEAAEQARRTLSRRMTALALLYIIPIIGPLVAAAIASYFRRKETRA